MKIIATFKKVQDLVDKKMKEQGYFTDGDLLEAGFSSRSVSFICYFLKRSDYSFFYLTPEEERVEYKYEVDKTKRKELTLCFYLKEAS